ncbi:MAG: hypothetical protein HY319_26455 [Armatimonadetes bacterium]|nr:hypothetical protein [Armatimonadota bacterium]
MKHYWNGAWLADEELDDRLEGLAGSLSGEFAIESSSDRLLQACGVLVERLAPGSALRRAVVERCRGARHTAEEVEAALDEVRDFFGPENLEKKLQRELAQPDPQLFERVDLGEPLFEAWAPLGLLVHIAPANALSVGPFSVLEGLLAGNLNLLKVPGDDPPFAALVLEALVQASGGSLAPFVKVVAFSSGQRGRLRRMLFAADGIAIWGGEEAVASVREMTPPGVRVIEWGHKISFAYLAAGRWADERTLEALARDCCRADQQLCTSPQAIYLETESYRDLEDFAGRFAPVLDRISRKVPGRGPEEHDWAEITEVCVLHRLEGLLGETRAGVVEPAHRGWRLLLDERPALVPSPLFRTLWVKPLPRPEIVGTLRPMRRYLQTVGLSCDPRSAAGLIRRFVQAGAARVTAPGSMLWSYPGEAHDGVYALQRYSRRMGLRLEDWAARMSSLAEISDRPPPPPPAGAPLMTKEDFQAQPPDRFSQLYFHSGGSSGAPKLSYFAYEDFHYHLSLGAEGLFAAGLDPAADRCMNLFFAGDLYAGFLCTYIILERLKAVQMPMTALSDYGEVARTIAELGVNTLLGMPSYIVELFRSHGDELRAYRGVKKIFYAGEHFSPAQRRWLEAEYGVRHVRSLAYGSVDVGFQGYQCTHCEGGVHHLHARLQTLEILHPERDEPVAPGKGGRLVFTAAHRRGQRVVRYEPGDLGRWVEGPCPCGRTSPRFELLGRHGDVFRIGTNFFNYRKFGELLYRHLGYTGPVQLVLAEGDRRERIELRLEREEGLDADAIRRALLENEPHLRESVIEDRLLDFQVDLLGAAELEHSSSSGKLKEVLDRRQR